MIKGWWDKTSTLKEELRCSSQRLGRDSDSGVSLCLKWNAGSLELMSVRAEHSHEREGDYGSPKGGEMLSSRNWKMDSDRAVYGIYVRIGYGQEL